MSETLLLIAKVIVIGMVLFLATTFCVVAFMVIRELIRLRKERKKR